MGLRENALSAGTAIHTSLGVIAGNSWALHLHEQVTNQMRRYKLFTNHTQARRDAALAEHEQICTAIVAGEAERASQLAFIHVIHARDTALLALVLPEER